jgi:hypothetical protein
MGLSTLKKEIIIKFALATSLDQLEGNELIIVTSFGIITGSLAGEINDIDIDFDDKNQVGVAFLTNITHDLVSDYQKKNSIDKDQLLDGNDGFISLTDVVIKTSTTTFNLHFLNVFYDQIIGVTLGNVQSN